MAISQFTSTPTSVYRYYDKHRVLIYVGITSRGLARNIEHNTAKAWWPYVVHQEVDHFSTREDALKAEKQLIRRYRPPFNKQHNPFHGELRAIFEAYANRPADPNAAAPKAGLLMDLYKLSGKRILLRRTSRSGLPAHFTSDESCAPLVAALDADLYGFKVGMLKESAVRVERQRGTLVAHLWGQGLGSLKAVDAHIACICINPFRLQVRSVSTPKGAV